MNKNLQRAYKTIKSADYTTLELTDIFDFLSLIKKELLQLFEKANDIGYKILAETPQNANYIVFVYSGDIVDAENDYIYKHIKEIQGQKDFEELTKYLIAKLCVRYKDIIPLEKALLLDAQKTPSDTEIINKSILQLKKALYDDILGTIRTLIEFDYIDNNPELKIILSLQHYKAIRTDKDKEKFLFTRTYISRETNKRYPVALIDFVKEYKQTFFDFVKEENKDTYFDYGLLRNIKEFLLANLIFLYGACKQETPPDYFSETTKQNINNLKENNFVFEKLSLKNEEELTFLTMANYNFLETIDDIENFYKLLFDLHNFIIKKASDTEKKHIEIKKTPLAEATKETHDLILNDKALYNIYGAFNNFKDLKDKEAIKDVRAFSGYLKRIARTKKDFDKLSFDFFELKKQQPDITRIEALDIIAPKRPIGIEEYYDNFNNIDFTLDRPYKNFDIKTNTEIITSNYNSIEISIDFGGALTLTRYNKETMDFLRFIIDRIVKGEADKEPYIDFTIFEFDTFKGISNHTQESRTRNKIEDVIDALDFARINQKANYIEKGETHFASERIHILSKLDTDETTKQKSYRVFIDNNFIKFIKDIINKDKQGKNGQHITYINKNIIDLTKTIGNNGIRQKARTLAEYLTEIKRVRENKPKYQKDFIGTSFIYNDATIKDVIDILLTRKQFNKNYKKRFKLFCVDVLHNVFNTLITNDIADIHTDAFDNYNKQPETTGRIIATKQSNFLNSPITFILKDIKKTYTAKQIIRRIKKKTNKK